MLGKQYSKAYLATPLKGKGCKQQRNNQPEISENVAQKANTMDRLPPEVAAHGSTFVANHSANLDF